MRPLLLLSLALLLLHAAAADSVHVRVHHTRHGDHDHAPQATPTPSPAKTMAMANTTMTNMTMTTTTMSNGTVRNPTAAVKFTKCPDLRTLTDGCADTKSDGEQLTCVVGGQWSEVAPIAADDLEDLEDGAADMQSTCTKAFSVTWIMDAKEHPTDADASGLRIQAVDSFQRNWTSLYGLSGLSIDAVWAVLMCACCVSVDSDLSNNLLTGFNVSAAIFENRAISDSVWVASESLLTRQVPCFLIS